MVRIDAVASWPHLADHLVPIWHALPAEVRGTFWAGGKPVAKHLAALGVQATLGLPHHHGPPTLVANHHDLTQTHRARAVAYVEHGAGQTYVDAAGHPSYSGGSDRQRVRVFLTLNETTAARERAAYPHAEVVVVGSPHLDALRAVELLPRGPRPCVAFAFHWDCPLVPETRETFTWWRRAVRALAYSGRFEVLVHAHPRIAGQVERWAANAGLRFERRLDVMLAAADVVAVDNSSVLYEAAALRLPVVALNHPRYRREVHHGLRFWDLVPGPQVDRREDLEAALVEARSGRWADVAVAVADVVYPPETVGRAAELAAQAAMRGLLGVRAC